MVNVHGEYVPMARHNSVKCVDTDYCNERPERNRTERDGEKESERMRMRISCHISWKLSSIQIEAKRKILIAIVHV